MVFSITSRNSFDRINQINESLLNVLGDAIEIPRVLVGSMLDLSEQRQVSYRVSLLRLLLAYLYQTSQLEQQLFSIISFLLHDGWNTLPFPA